jgi:drug/metabolite transporter (DMT)-like permease
MADRSASTRGVIAVLVAFAGLSLGSTIAKSSGSPGPVVAFWRLLIGAVLWHLLIAVKGIRDGSSRTVGVTPWRVATVSGIAVGVNLSFFFSGVIRTPIAHAEFINALTPLILIPLAAHKLKERVHRYIVICGAIALSGIVLILSQAPGKGSSYLGDLLVVCSMVAWVFYLMKAKIARTQLSTPHFMAVMSTVACITTLPIALVTAGGPASLFALSAKGWFLVATLAITAGMVSHGLIAWAQRRVPVGTISMLQLGQPALGVLWAATFLGESVKAIQLIGMAIVVGAVGTIAWRSAQDSATPGSSAVRSLERNRRPDGAPALLIDVVEADSRDRGGSAEERARQFDGRRVGGCAVG